MESPNLPATWLPILKHHLRDTVFSFQFYFPKVTDLRGRDLRLLCKWGRCSREKAVFSGIFEWLMTGMGVLRCGVLPIVKTRLLQSSCYIHTNAISVSTVVGGASKRSQPLNWLTIIPVRWLSGPILLCPNNLSVLPPSRCAMTAVNWSTLAN